MTTLREAIRRARIVNLTSVRDAARLFFVPSPISVRNLIHVAVDVTSRLPAIEAFAISPRQISAGDAITVTWRAQVFIGCTDNVRLTQKNFHTGAVLGQHDHLDTSGTFVDRPQVDSNYFLDILCADGRKAQQQRISVGVRNPSPPPGVFCFKVEHPDSGICSTYSVLATSKDQAQGKVSGENPPPAIVTAINCSEITTACG
jgi:hypothetical protein